MKVELEFTSKAQTPRLVRVSFWANGKENSRIPSNRLTGAGWIENPDEQDRVFHWRNGVRSLAILLLQAYAKGSPYSGQLCGNSESPAASLLQALRDTNPEAKSHPFWIHEMFTPSESPNAKRAKWQLPDSMFVRYANQDKDVDNYRVELGSEWQKAELIILRGETQLTASEAGDLAHQILSQFDAARRALRTRQHRPKPPPLRCEITLSTYNNERQSFASIEEIHFPVPVSDGVSISINLNKPAFPYVFWITSAKKVQPLYPWTGLTWKSKFVEHAVHSLSLPDACLDSAGGFYPLDCGAGVELAIALVTERQLQPVVRNKLEEILPQCLRWVPKNLPDSRQLHHLTDRRALSRNCPIPRLGAPVVAENPLAQLEEGLLSLIGYAVPCIAGIAFTTRSTPA
jgi:hypothetical protein